MFLQSTSGDPTRDPAAALSKTPVSGPNVGGSELITPTPEGTSNGGASKLPTDNSVASSDSRPGGAISKRWAHLFLPDSPLGILERRSPGFAKRMMRQRSLATLNEQTSAESRTRSHPDLRTLRRDQVSDTVHVAAEQALRGTDERLLAEIDRDLREAEGGDGENEGATENIAPTEKDLRDAAAAAPDRKAEASGYLTEGEKALRAASALRAELINHSNDALTDDHLAKLTFSSFDRTLMRVRILGASYPISYRALELRTALDKANQRAGIPSGADDPLFPELRRPGMNLSVTPRPRPTPSGGRKVLKTAGADQPYGSQLMPARTPTPDTDHVAGGWNGLLGALWERPAQPESRDPSEAEAPAPNAAPPAHSDAPHASTAEQPISDVTLQPVADLEPAAGSSEQAAPRVSATGGTDSIQAGPAAEESSGSAEPQQPL